VSARTECCEKGKKRPRKSPSGQGGKESAVEVDWTMTSPILSCSGVVDGMAASLVVREETD